MSLIKNILESTSKTKSRTQKVGGSINNLMTTMLLQKQAQAAQAAQAQQLQAAPQAGAVLKGAVPAGAPKAQHSAGDGHDHAGGKGLDPDFQKRLNALIKAAGGGASVGSGYRSIAEQTKIYNLWKAGKHPAPLVAKPGSSNHNYGLAADLKYLNKDVGAKVRALAPQFGLRFPMANEPWHVEPVDARAKRKARS